MCKLLSKLVPCMCLIAGGISAGGPTGVGAKYGTRDPATCVSSKEPTKGVITPELAKKYLACHRERESSGRSLFLIENVTVEVGKGTPYLELPGGARPFGGDPSGLVYQIRGSLKVYSCGVVNAMTAAGRNCRTSEETKATGECFRDGFGDWICNMAGPESNELTEQPPPGKR